VTGYFGPEPDRSSLASVAEGCLVTAPTSHAPSHPLSRLLVHVLLVLAAVVASTCLTVPGADATTQRTRDRVVRIAASKHGAPYRYGAAGPRAFDCSGYTRWVYAKVGRHLPRTSRAQRGATRHIRRADRRRGDLVFFSHGGRVYHVAIYAGHDRVWHAPRSGQRVRREHIWTRSVSYGRVR
jgi:cell wall-associated NlpC family hydrolase